MIFPYNDKTISYRIQGSGPAVVLLHGFLENMEMWAILEEQLNTDFTTLIIDLPGHGNSEVFSETHSMEDMASVVRALMAHLQIESVSLIGHSMGGYVALAFLESYQEMVRQIILLNSTPYADSEERRQNRGRALELIPKNKNLFIPVAITNLFAEDTRNEFSTEIEQLIRDANHMPVDGILAAIRGMRDRKGRSSVLKRFSGSKVIIAGTKDSVVPINDSRKVAKMTGSKLFEVDSGHMTLVENVKEIPNIVHFIE
ncbi:alpha/beta hydrolase [Aureitalea sp. L0-47]|uniref:alpha/beta fold hydrolase n=1 Tax=Aureitalea sp. L0-47 TaxID=2816962 RepID=UPI0022386C82|nr:alpha/beta hydrolase [Aureitalea sp. L0-47]MCW5518329.1 alpha/beta hydrolase [Aureitalea sp. L0-47]